MTPNPEQTAISAQQVKELRDRTGAGFMACRSALTEANGDFEQAVQVLRKRGQAIAQKKAGREATEGSMGSYVHAGGKIGVLVEVNCETDFVARTDEFQQLCHDVAMHIAALDPRFVRREDVTEKILEREREVYREQARTSGRPEKFLDQIVSGKMDKFYEENCLYEQRFIKDEAVTVRELIEQAVARLGEKVSVRRFVRFKVGEEAAAGAPVAPSPAQ
ncbi:MAG TPA: translation elongation factor Ts [Candidatus Dormibacteraeota bacterium]|nr:translation elongation factor Ts [Candidatus Dormibacteraeota bacterium]